MKKSKLLLLLTAVLGGPLPVRAQLADPCANLATLKIDGAEITKSALIPAGTTVPPPYPGAQGIGPLPAHCRVDGVINRRMGVDGEEFGIGFALALPETAAWKGDFTMQGGGFPVVSRRRIDPSSIRQDPDCRADGQFFKMPGFDRVRSQVHS